MNQLIIVCAADLIFIASAYAFLNVIIKRDRKHLLQELVIVFGSAVFAWVLAHVLKGIVMHPRPGVLAPLITPDDVYSFPSGHATYMFALSAAMYFFDKKAGKLLLVLAVVTAVARVLAGAHFWYDVLGGAVLGVVVAYGVSVILDRIRTRSV